MRYSLTLGMMLCAVGSLCGATSKVYWVDPVADTIQRANVDGTQREDLITTGLSLPRDVAVDALGGKMYWIDTGRIERANLDGTQRETVRSSLIGGGDGITIDPYGQKIYWTVYSNRTYLRRANLDGSGVETLISSSYGLDHVWDLSLDLVNGKVYFAEYWDDRIYRCNLDGSGIETLIDMGGGLNLPCGIEVDPENGYMYLVDTPGPPGRLLRANLDGSGLTVLGQMRNPRDLALDAQAERLYVGNFDCIYEYDLAGLKTGTVLPVTSIRPKGIAVDSLPVPEPATMVLLGLGGLALRRKR